VYFILLSILMTQATSSEQQASRTDKQEEDVLSSSVVVVVEASFAITPSSFISIERCEAKIVSMPATATCASKIKTPLQC
jgi:hypothetical protein